MVQEADKLIDFHKKKKNKKKHKKLQHTMKYCNMIYTIALTI